MTADVLTAADADAVAEFRRLFPDAARYAGLTPRDRTADCARCGRLLIHADDAGQRSRREVPPVVAERLTVRVGQLAGERRPFCSRCVRAVIGGRG